MAQKKNAVTDYRQSLINRTGTRGAGTFAARRMDAMEANQNGLNVSVPKGKAQIMARKAAFAPALKKQQLQIAKQIKAK